LERRTLSRQATVRKKQRALQSTGGHHENVEKVEPSPVRNRCLCHNCFRDDSASRIPLRASGIAEEKRACELVKQGPDVLRRFVDRTRTIYQLYFYDYVTEADWNRWTRHVGTMKRGPTWPFAR